MENFSLFCCVWLVKQREEYVEENMKEEVGVVSVPSDAGQREVVGIMNDQGDYKRCAACSHIGPEERGKINKVVAAAAEASLNKHTPLKLTSVSILLSVATRAASTWDAEAKVSIDTLSPSNAFQRDMKVGPSIVTLSVKTRLVTGNLKSYSCRTPLSVVNDNLIIGGNSKGAMASIPIVT